MYDHTRKKSKPQCQVIQLKSQAYKGLPKAGDYAISVPDEREARLTASRRKAENRLKERLHAQKTKDDVFLKRMDAQLTQLQELSIVKSDVCMDR